ncbi:MAG: hypothetical protein ACUVX1_15695 [Chloroflexota bacterium]
MSYTVQTTGQLMPCDYSRYYPHWRDIRRQILDQANNCCEFCGVPNHQYVVRTRADWYVVGEMGADAAWLDGKGAVHIILTVAHLNHDVTDLDPANLRALCQRCHLRWDVEQHQRNAARTRARKRSAGTTPMPLWR